MCCTAGEARGEGYCWISIAYFACATANFMAISMGFPTGFSMDFLLRFLLAIGRSLSWLYVRIGVSSRESAPREGDTVMGTRSIITPLGLGVGTGFPNWESLGLGADPRASYIYCRAAFRRRPAIILLLLYTHYYCCQNACFTPIYISIYISRYTRTISPVSQPFGTPTA